LLNFIDKYKDNGNTRGYNKVITEKNAGLIIAISLAKTSIGTALPTFLFTPSMYDIYKNCLFNKDNLAKYNSNGECISIKTDYFTSKQYSYVSAILISEREEMILSIPKEKTKLWTDCKNDFFLIHNPHAAIQLPRNILPISTEYFEDEKT